MKLKKCKKCEEYTLNEKCDCGEKTNNAHYKFLRIRDAPKSDVNVVRRN